MNKNLKIAFHTKELNLRGTCIALYDYAHYFEKLLYGKSIIIIYKNANHDENVLLKFKKRFLVKTYTTNTELENFISDCDIFYTIKYGLINDEYIPSNIKTCIHCVFDMSEPHGNVYASVSKQLAQKYGKTLYVPHMISLKASKNKMDNLRKELKIPENDIVFGRHGGLDTFDLRMTHMAIARSLIEKQNIHYIFVNTMRFVKHDRVYFINKIIDNDEKNRFICSCDAMIHGQSLGETFGIAIGEFSINNKPIIAYNGAVWNDNYKHILKDKALWYTTENECYNILVNFNPKIYENINLNCYEEYSPEIVMMKFKKVFIDNDNE
jgi:hypothetical protein